jgi:hypothetical protein
MKQFVKVQGHDSLIRDVRSNAIISSNDLDYEAYKRSRQNVLKQREMIKTQTEEIQNLKSEMQEIKQMLSTLIKGK